MPKLEPWYLGIDPGKTGGLTLLRDEGVFYQPMPATPLDLWIWMGTMLLTTPVGSARTRAVLEQVGGYIKKKGPQPGSAMFNFGRGYGELRMALTAAGIRYEEITPRVWQKVLGIPPKKESESKSDFKGRLRARAQRLFPSLELWKGTKTDQLACCDALLIAEYCRRREWA